MLPFKRMVVSVVGSFGKKDGNAEILLAPGKSES
jgi:hypothetical protein